MDPIKIVIIVLTLLIGLCVGSFLNVVIYRLPNEMSLAYPASHCPKCEHELKWYDNIPLFSYIFLRGKCRYCKCKISFRYPLVEFTNMALWFGCLVLFTDCVISTNSMYWVRFIASCIACSALLCVFFTDLDHMEIPDELQVVLLMCGLAMLVENNPNTDILIKVIGFFACGALFYIVNFVFKLIKKRDGIGFGDVKLVAVTGLILGAYNMIVALTLSCVVGGIALLIVSLIQKERGREYPFAILLVPGILVALFFGDFIVKWYMGLMGL